MRHLRLFENVGSKKYGFTYFIRDYKESMRDIMPQIKKFMKNYPDFMYEDVETGWNDSIYTVVSNYPNPQKLVDQFGEDMFLAIDYNSDDNGMIWFDGTPDLKKAIKDGVNVMLAAEKQESDEYEALQALGKQGKALEDKYLKEIEALDKEGKNWEKIKKLPKRFGWSMVSAATWLALKELGKLPKSAPIKEAEEKKVEKIKLEDADKKEFAKDFSVDGKYVFDEKMSDEDKEKLLMAKIEELIKKKHINPGKAEKMRKSYEQNIKKIGIKNVEDDFTKKWYDKKYSPKKERAKGYLKKALGPSPGAVYRFEVLDDLYNDLFD